MIFYNSDKITHIMRYMEKRNFPWNFRVRKEYYDAFLQRFKLKIKKKKLLDSMGMSDFKK